MPHSYKFANPEHTTVQRDDGASFVWPEGVNIGNVHSHGRIAEQFRLDDGPHKTAPYKPEVSPKALAVLVTALGEDDAARVSKALLAAGYQIVKTPRPCR
jgi:hypothetical protein